MLSEPLALTSRPILVPVDFSAASKAAVLTACALVESAPVPLLVVHVVHEDPEHAGFYRSHDSPHLLRPVADIAMEMMDDFAGGLRLENPQVPALRGLSTRVVTGLPSQRIVELCRNTRTQ